MLKGRDQMHIYNNLLLHAMGLLYKGKRIHSNICFYPNGSQQFCKKMSKVQSIQRNFENYIPYAHHYKAVSCTYILYSIFSATYILQRLILQYALYLRKPDFRKNLDQRKIVATTNFLAHKLFDL